MTEQRIANEVIDFQKDNFGLKLEAVFEEINELIKNTPSITGRQLDKAGFGKKLSDLIFERMGIKTNFVFNTETAGAIFVFPINRNHVLLKDFFRDAYFVPEQSVLTKKFEKQKGTIDLKKARVTGIFSEYQHTVLFGYTQLVTQLKITPREATGILLHEIGHAFTYYEFSDQFETTNQVLFDLSQAIKDDDKKKRVYLFKELSKELGKKPDFFDDILEEDNRIIVSSKIFKTYIQSVKTQLNHSKYDETSSEQLADNFASRFGYGRDLIEILDRLHKYSPEKNVTTYFMYQFFEAIALLWLGIRPYVIYMLGFGPVVIFLAVLLSVLVVYLLGDENKDMTYDDLLIRYKRVRQQYIEQIKDLDIPNDQLKDIVDTIHGIDEIMKKTSQYNSLFAAVSNFIFSNNRTAKESVRLQQLVEEVVHNDLFLKSSELKTLA